MSVRKLWRLWGLVLVAVILAWLALQDAPSPNETPTVRATRQRALLPALAPSPRPADPAQSLATLSQSTIWGPLPSRAASGATSDGEAPLTKWSLSGFYETSGIKFVIVSFEQQARPSQQLKVGDKLPDGSRIVQIETDRVRVRAPTIGAVAEGASAPTSGWLPITPGLPMPASKRQR